MGIPVATVAIDNAANAALLAAQIIAVSNVEVAAKLQGFRENQTETVMQKVKAIES
jgi:phosphoribosylcarboxyaminoimidazole (NCAIR) mutase